MKHINPQLTDAMILALADAHDSGVDFSTSINLALIPEFLAPEAKTYWNLLEKQMAFSTTITPDISILDSIFEKMDAATVLPVAKERTPSPYMKYVMVFAAPLSIIVMIFGLSFRQNTDTISAPIEEIGPSMLSVDSTADNKIMMARAIEPTPIQSDVVTRVARKAETMSASVESSKGDPKQLFALLSEAGSQEAESETQIDEVYDARLLELDSQVIGTDNPTTYEAL